MNELFPDYKISYSSNKLFDNLKNIQDDIDLWHDVYGDLCAKSKIVNNNYLFYLIDFGYFLYEINNDKLTIYPDKKENNHKVEDVYYRIFLPLILHIKGIESIHSSGIENNAGVIAFAGYSGVGKSTIAYSFSKRGYELWADDCIAILKNRDDSICSIKIPFTLRLKNTKGHKNLSYRPDVENNNIIKRKPLIKIIELTKNEKSDSKIDIKRLVPKNSLEVLLKHTYYCSLNERDLKARMFNNFSFIANTLPVYTIQYPDDKMQISKLVDVLEELIIE